MSNKFIEKCPFGREGTASRAIYMALAKASTPLTMAEISKRSKVPFKKTETLVRAYQNPFHNAPLRRAGIAIIHEPDGFKLESCKAQPKAKRPERGQSATKKVAPKAAAKKKVKTPTTAPTTTTIAPAPVASPASEIK